ncbi:MAG TPA: hypothetical protein VGP25_00995 [Gemmatimonadaceae bacterium]|jgi:hypothetical protein|nr:hypothetical protein [Gemmatimonadaceae bacterium]
MRLVPVTSVGAVPAPVLAVLAPSLRGLATLSEVLGWARAHEPALTVAEIVTQDEYTHDVVIPFDGSHFLVFDAT